MTLTHTKLSNIAHLCFGFLAAILGYEHLFTAVYLAYQVVDLLCEKRCEEFKEDIVEYVLGLLAGALIKLYILR